MKNQTTYIKELVWKHIQGESSVTDKKELGDWVAQSDANKMEYLKIKEEAEVSVVETGQEEWVNFYSGTKLMKHLSENYRSVLF